MDLMEDPEMNVELGPEVPARRSRGTATVAVRVPTDLLARMQRYASERGLTVSEVLRAGADRMLEGAEQPATTRTIRVALDLGMDVHNSVTVRLSRVGGEQPRITQNAGVSHTWAASIGGVAVEA